MVVTAGAVMLLGAAAVPVGRATVLRRPLAGWFQRAEPLASLTVQTRPAGAEVFIDGKPSGVSPMTVSVAAGAHRISARLGTTERVVPFTLSAGTQVVQYLELEQPAPDPQTRMSVTTAPPGARVDIDGTTRGRSPVDVSNLAPGVHRVSVVGETGSAERTVMTTAGSALAVVFTLKPSHVEPTDGWAVVQAPFEVQLLEHGDVVGMSSAKIMMAAGVHQITLRNAQLGYEEDRRVVVTPGKTVVVGVTPPNASLSVNARPWADVSIDGNAVGETPLANVTIGIGSHQVVFRHPQFGERRQTLVVTLKGPNRVAVDFTRKP